MQPAFTIGDAVSYGWKKTMENFGFLVILTLGFFILSFVIAGAAEGEGPLPLIILYKILNVIVSYLAMYTFVHVGLKIYRGEKPQVKDVFKIDWTLFGLYIVAGILSMIVTAVGFVLLVIPGIILVVRLGVSGFALVEDRLGPIVSLRRSWDLTRGRFWHLLGFSLVLGLINLLGALLIGIGLLVTSPLCLIATVYVYQKLKEAQALVPAAPITPATTA